MNRIVKKFEELKKAGKKGLVGYLTAGDPDVEVSERNIRTAIEGGLDVLELGVPFSDPTADGPVIQEASQRALAGNMTVAKALKMVSNIRRYSNLPVILFGYANPFFRYGYNRICADAASSGVDGMLIVDLPFEESGELLPYINEHEMCFIPLIAPTTSGERSGRVLKDARGFVYYIMVTGVTGARKEIAGDIIRRVEELRRYTSLPIAVGFGVSNGKQARLVGESADAVVVGSALVKAAKEGCLADLVKDLRIALG
ncbi:MAG: tryptophan synthase subunit alpha [Kiritimatiellae bacterium]|nr:tryptophan synthase subunit alpha [Kiritimatiellia bacterium]MDD5520910.1 tryptophan synthase subunit alpha [Kiritimatiellia bacterium]